jgi:hypothetical protein
MDLSDVIHQERHVSILLGTIMIFGKKLHIINIPIGGNNSFFLFWSFDDTKK